MQPGVRQGEWINPYSLSVGAFLPIRFAVQYSAISGPDCEQQKPTSLVTWINIGTIFESVVFCFDGSGDTSAMLSR